MPNNLVVAIHPRYGDPFTLLSQTWVKNVERAVATNKYEVIEIFSTDASRTKPAFDLVKNNDVVLIMGIGHGTETQFFGYGDAETLYDPTKLPPSELKNRFVHLCACLTAVTLGGDFINAKCAAFIGYRGMITFGSDAVNTAIAVADAQIDLALAAGRSVSQAIQAAQSNFRNNGLDNIGQLLVSNPADCTLKLPPQITGATPNMTTSNSTPANSLASNTIASHATVPANSVVANTI